MYENLEQALIKIVECTEEIKNIENKTIDGIFSIIKNKVIVSENHCLYHFIVQSGAITYDTVQMHVMHNSFANVIVNSEENSCILTDKNSEQLLEVSNEQMIIDFRYVPFPEDESDYFNFSLIHDCVFSFLELQLIKLYVQNELNLISFHVSLDWF